MLKLSKILTAADEFYAWGYRDHEVNRFRPFRESHAEDMGSILTPLGLPTRAAYACLKKWNELSGDERYTLVINPPRGLSKRTRGRHIRGV